MPSGDPDMPVIEKGVYLHSKSGKSYEVLGVAMHSESHEPLVVYRPRYDTKYELFVRPYDMFTEQIILNGKQTPRFLKVLAHDG